MNLQLLLVQQKLKSVFCLEKHLSHDLIKEINYYLQPNIRYYNVNHLNEVKTNYQRSLQRLKENNYIYNLTYEARLFRKWSIKYTWPSRFKQYNHERYFLYPYLFDVIVKDNQRNIEQIYESYIDFPRLNYLQHTMKLNQNPYYQFQYNLLKKKCPYHIETQDRYIYHIPINNYIANDIK